MTRAKQQRQSVASCQWCGVKYEPKNYLQKYCSHACRTVAGNANDSRHQCGPCPTCGAMFRSRRKDKVFCSLQCYTASDQFKEMSMANISTASPNVGSPKICPACNCEFPRSRRAKYCSDRCRRRFFAERFDRWIANPEQISLPQNFDEFLVRDVLPCPVVGCGWEGEHLSTHVNFAHGITAREFKKLCGFNIGTGLVGEKLSAWFSERTKRFIADGIIKSGDDCNLVPGYQGSRSFGYVSLESKEHRAKANAMRPNNSQKTNPCRECGVLVAQPFAGRKEYCSTACRSRYYSRTKTCECRCAQCGLAFVGTRAQSRRHMNGLNVCCSQLCRNRMNIVAALSARGLSLVTANPIEAMHGTHKKH